MWGIVPSAGSGSRIQPLAFSKELLPVGSRAGARERPRAVSEYIVDRMILAGATRICMVIAPDKHDILSYYGGSVGPASVCYAVQPEYAGLCDAIFRALPMIADHEDVLVGLPDAVWFPEDGLARLGSGGLRFLLFPVDRPDSFEAVVTDPLGRVLEIQVKSPNVDSAWIWGAFKLNGSILRELHDLWRERDRVDRDVGTLVNAWLARGGRATGVRAGQTYVDVGTLEGYRDALARLRDGAGGERSATTPPPARASASVRVSRRSRSPATHSPVSPVRGSSSSVSIGSMRQGVDRVPRARARLTTSQVAERVHELGPWFHNLDLAGIATAPDHLLGDYPRVRWERFRRAIPEDLRGKTVLDIGCNAGFYAIEMKRRGASRVVAIDTDEDSLAQARFAAEVSGVDVELRKMSVFDVGSLGERFDLVLFLGVLYHLRHPLLALDLLHEHAVAGLLVFQSMLCGSTRIAEVEDDYPFEERAIFEDAGFPRMAFVEHRYAGDPTHWWMPNRACAEAMLRSAGFEIVDRPEEEVTVCRRRGEPAPTAAHVESTAIEGGSAAWSKR